MYYKGPWFFQCTAMGRIKNRRSWGLFPPPPPLLTRAYFFGVTSGFTRLVSKTKYVLINYHVNNYLKWTINLLVKTCRWGGGGYGRKTSHDEMRFKLKFNIKKLYFKWTVWDEKLSPLSSSSNDFLNFRKLFSFEKIQFILPWQLLSLSNVCL